MGTIYGYARISTPEQSLARQVENIKRVEPGAIIVSEAYTGKRLDRPQWQKLYKVLKEGDTVIFDEVSRMSRNAEEGFKLYNELYGKGISLVFIKEPHINTSVYREALSYNLPTVGNEIADEYIAATNRVMLKLAKKQIYLAFESAENEIAFLSQRTREGMAQAKLNGKTIGRIKGRKYESKKSLEKKEIIEKHAKTFGGSLSDIECIQLTGLARNTYYKYKREILEARGNNSEAQTQGRGA